VDAVTDVRELELGGQRPALVRRLGAFLSEEGLLVGIVALFVAFWAAAAADFVAADTWLTLLGGREVSAHGIPHSDSLALISHGHSWIDQQWLAQTIFWRLDQLGGMRLAVLAAVGLLLVPLALGIALARRRGASQLAIAPFAVLPALHFSSFIRAELFSHLLFVVVLALLAAESRRRSWRVLLAFPLLVLWANLHGAVVEGAALVVLLGLCEAGSLLRARGHDRLGWLRAGALVVGPWLCLLATPYGASVIRYYEATVGNSALRATQQEWAPPNLLSIAGFPVFLLAGAALVLVTRRRRDLTSFELAALAGTLVGALIALRSAPWFAYTCLLFLPALAQRKQATRSDARSRRLWILFGSVAAAIALVATLASTAAPASRLDRYWPGGAASAVGRALERDPHARVFASYEYGDWLLFRVPALRGRIAFDGRWEVLPQEQIFRVWRYLWQIGDDWEAPARGYRLLVLNPRSQASLIKTYERRPGVRVLFRDRWAVVLDRGPAADPRS
jgi:hypothetical protein